MLRKLFNPSKLHQLTLPIASCLFTLSIAIWNTGAAAKEATQNDIVEMKNKKPDDLDNAVAKKLNMYACIKMRKGDRRGATDCISYHCDIKCLYVCIIF